MPIEPQEPLRANRSPPAEVSEYALVKISRPDFARLRRLKMLNAVSEHDATLLYTVETEDPAVRLAIGFGVFAPTCSQQEAARNRLNKIEIRKLIRNAILRPIASTDNEYSPIASDTAVDARLVSLAEADENVNALIRAGTETDDSRSVQFGLKVTTRFGLNSH